MFSLFTAKAAQFEVGQRVWHYDAPFSYIATITEAQLVFKDYWLYKIRTDHATVDLAAYPDKLYAYPFDFAPLMEQMEEDQDYIRHAIKRIEADDAVTKLYYELEGE